MQLVCIKIISRQELWKTCIFFGKRKIPKWNPQFARYCWQINLVPLCSFRLLNLDSLLTIQSNIAHYFGNFYSTEYFHFWTNFENPSILASISSLLAAKTSKYGQNLFWTSYLKKAIPMWYKTNIYKHQYKNTPKSGSKITAAGGKDGHCIYIFQFMKFPD